MPIVTSGRGKGGGKGGGGVGKGRNLLKAGLSGSTVTPAVIERRATGGHRKKRSEAVRGIRALRRTGGQI